MSAFLLFKNKRDLKYRDVYDIIVYTIDCGGNEMRIKNVRIYTMNDNDHVIENGFVTVENGIITGLF